MTAPRRRLVRPAPPPAQRPPTERRAQKLRERLTTQRAALARWQAKLRRAFTTVAKLQKAIARLERQLAQREE